MKKKELWTVKYAPKTQEDILISKTTFQQINSFFEQKVKSVLFLFGPSGCGKTSTIDVCCEMNGLQKIEEKNLIDNMDFTNISNNEKYSKTSATKNDVFKAALLRSMNKIFNPELNVIILRDLPTKISEDKNLIQLMSSYTNRKTKKTRIIFILNSVIYNETQILKAYEPIYKENGIKIDLKPYSEKAIETALLRIYRNEEILKILKEDIIKEKINEFKYTSNGDLKNSINNLYTFALSLQNPTTKVLKQKIENSKSKRKIERGKSKLVKATMKNDLSKLQKDYGMSLFNILGKFLYNKRKDPITNEIKQMTKNELKSGKMEFYFSPKDLIRQMNVSPSIFRCFLFENYLDFYGDIEDVLKTSEDFSQSNIFEQINFWKERNEDIKLDNEYFNTFYIGSSVMLNNYNSQKFDHLKQFSGPKICKLPEKNRNFKRKLKESFSSLAFSMQLSDFTLNMREVNTILTKKSGVEFRNLISKEILNENCFVIETNENMSEDFKN